MNLYLMRHGETEWNRLRKIQGQADNPLNETGRREAMRSGYALSTLRFDKCYCSPLLRARETAALALSGRDCPIVYEELIKEISYGIDEGQFLDEIERKKELPLHNYFADPEHFIPPKGGESIQELQLRCCKFLDKVKEEEGRFDNILAVCHGAFIQGIILSIHHLEPALFWAGREQKNCAVTLACYENNTWKIEKEAVDILKGEKLT